MAICLLSCAGYPRTRSRRTHPKCWWHPRCVGYLRSELWASEMNHLNTTCKTAEKEGKPLWSLASSSSSHIPAWADPAPIGKLVQIARNPAGVREGRGWVCKNTKNKMRRRSWFFLTPSTGWPLSSMERWSSLSAPCKFLVRCTQRGCPRLWWMEGWRWMDVRTHAETQLLLSSPAFPIFLHKYACPITYHFLQSWQLMWKCLGLKVFI